VKKVYLAILLLTATEGGFNTIFPPYLQQARYPVEQIGMIVALFAVLQLAARLPAGALYVGKAKPLFVAFVLLFIAGTGGFAYEGGTPYLIALTMAHGFAFGGIGTVMLAWAIELKPQNSTHGATMGWYTAALSAGYSIGNFCGGYLADSLGYALTFVVVGLVPSISILAGLTLPTPSVPLVPSVPSEAEPKRRRRMELRELQELISPNLALATLIAIYLNILDDGFATFFPLFALGTGLSLTFIGLLKSVKSLTATLLRPLAGGIFRYINFKTLNNLLIVTWAVVIVLLPSLRAEWMFFLVFITIGVCRGLLRVTSATMLAEEKAKETGGIGIASAVYNAGLDIGGFAGPLIAGYVASVTDIPTMFRVVPVALLATYLLAAVWVERAGVKRASMMRET
jgi:MFS family permease